MELEKEAKYVKGLKGVRKAAKNLLKKEAKLEDWEGFQGLQDASKLEKAVNAGGGALVGGVPAFFVGALKGGVARPLLYGAGGAGLGALYALSALSDKKDLEYAIKKRKEEKEKTAGVNMIGLNKLANAEDDKGQEMDSKSAPMLQEMGQFGLAKAKAEKSKGMSGEESDKSNVLAEETKQALEKEAMGIARAGAKAIKSPKYKVNEVMKATPPSKRDDVLRELRKSKQEKTAGKIGDFMKKLLSGKKYPTTLKDMNKAPASGMLGQVRAGQKVRSAKAKKKK